MCRHICTIVYALRCKDIEGLIEALWRASSWQTHIPQVISSQSHKIRECELVPMLMTAAFKIYHIKMPAKICFFVADQQTKMCRCGANTNGIFNSAANPELVGVKYIAASIPTDEFCPVYVWVQLCSKAETLQEKLKVGSLLAQIWVMYCKFLARKTGGGCRSPKWKRILVWPGQKRAASRAKEDEGDQAKRGWGFCRLRCLQWIVRVLCLPHVLTVNNHFRLPVAEHLRRKHWGKPSLRLRPWGLVFR